MDNEQRRQAISRNLRILMNLTDVGVVRIADFLVMQKDLAKAKINGLVGITDAELISLLNYSTLRPKAS